MNANGGMSMANNYIVKFDIPGTGNLFAFYCDEAQLPNVNASTGTIKGRYMGEGQVCLLYTSPSPRDISGSRMPSSA